MSSGARALRSKPHVVVASSGGPAGKSVSTPAIAADLAASRAALASGVGAVAPGAGSGWES